MFTENMIAPCGLDCSLCSAALKSDAPCPGCLSHGENKPDFCKTLCTIIRCEKLIANKHRYCSECFDYPCVKIKEKEEYYMSQYVLKESPMTNLSNIQTMGINEFLNQQRNNWTCKKCDGVVCVHTGICSKCGKQYSA